MLLSKIDFIKDGVFVTKDSDFKESEHPRESDGKFTAGGGSAKSVSVKMHKTKIVGGRRVSEDGKDLPKHISSLRIPPAWQDVSYNPDPNGDLLAIGKDAKGRSQYVYSGEHWSRAAEKKFARIKELADKFDAIQKQNSKDKSEEALVLSLIMHTGIRPGSDEDTQAKVKAYGATTLEGRHVKKVDGGVMLHFIGKKGVENKIMVTDKNLVKVLLERAEKSGPDGRLFDTGDRALLKHTSALDGGGFKTKDFRTLLGTKMAIDIINDMPKPKDDKDYKKAVMYVAKAVSQKLGNTPVVALQAYISPTVFGTWRI